MSAFLVSKEHLSFIITWAIDNGTLGGLSPQAWFKEFHRENIDSLKHRYQDCYRDLTYWEPNKRDRYIPVFNAIRPQKYQTEIAIALIKAIRCWEYQSCEHVSRQQRENELSWRMMRQISELALHMAGYQGDRIHDDHPVFDTDAYEQAPWEYSSKAWQQFANYLYKKKNSDAFNQTAS